MSTKIVKVMVDLTAGATQVTVRSDVDHPVLGETTYDDTVVIPGAAEYFTAGGLTSIADQAARIIQENAARRIAAKATQEAFVKLNAPADPAVPAPPADASVTIQA